MNKDNRCFQNYVGLLLVLLLSVFCFLTKISAVSAADETDNVQVKALDGIPEDLAIVYGSGATHAEWGRSLYKISADGNAVYEETRGRQSTVSRQQEYYQLTRGELQLIIKKIKDNRFFSLNEQYSNPKIRDGSSSYISVTMDKKTHSVSMINSYQKEFDEIAGLIVGIIDNKKSIKPEVNYPACRAGYPE